MISTLLKLGEYLSQNMTKWDDIIEIPKIAPKDMEKKKYILNIIFDIDNHDIIISPENLSEFDESESAYRHFLIKTLSARSGKTYIAVLTNKLDNLKISLFGKENESKGQFFDSVSN